MNLALYFVFVSWVVAVESVRQSLTIYPRPNFEGEPLIIINNYNSISQYQGKYLTNESSYISAGWWNCYTSGSSGRPEEHELGRNSHAPVQYPNAFRMDRFVKCTYMGASDTDEIGIALYNIPNSGWTTEGENIFVNGPFLTKVPWFTGYATMGFVSTGRSSWTLYTNESFFGVATCFVPSEKVHVHRLYGTEEQTVGSVHRGCDFGPIDKYIYL